MALISIGGMLYLARPNANIDSRYGPYASVQAAWDAVGPDGDDIACIGLTVGIQVSSTAPIEEYWFKSACDDVTDLVKKNEGGSGGTSDFEQLENRPKYNGTVMDKNTNIPEVKTTAWDAKMDKVASATAGNIATLNASGEVVDSEISIEVVENVNSAISSAIATNGIGWVEEVPLTSLDWNGDETGKPVVDFGEDQGKFIKITDNDNLPTQATIVQGTLTATYTEGEPATTTITSDMISTNQCVDCFTVMNAVVGGIVVASSNSASIAGQFNFTKGIWFFKNTSEGYTSYVSNLTYGGRSVTHKIDPNYIEGGVIPDAPSDGKQYARKDAAWTEVQGGSGGSDPAVVSAKESGGIGWIESSGQETIIDWDGNTTGKTKLGNTYLYLVSNNIPSSDSQLIGSSWILFQKYAGQALYKKCVLTSENIYWPEGSTNMYLVAVGDLSEPDYIGCVITDDTYPGGQKGMYLLSYGGEAYVSKVIYGSNTGTVHKIDPSYLSSADAGTEENKALLSDGAGGVKWGTVEGASYSFDNSIEEHNNTIMLPKIDETDEALFAISDSDGNSVVVIDNDGNIDFNLSQALITKLRTLGLGGNGNSMSAGEFDATVFMVPCVGQSLAINTSAGASTFSGTAPYSYNTSLNAANLQDMNGGFTEAFKICAAYHGVHVPKNFMIVTSVTGGGGQSINVFGKGSGYYNSVISNIRTAWNACKAAGLTMIVPGFMWTQGEEDMRTGGNKSAYGAGNWNPFDYHTKLKNMIDSYNEDVKAITGQTQDVCCFSYQVCTQTAYRRYPRIAFEQADLALTDPRMLLAKPMYNVTYGSDQVHAPAGTYRNMGNHYGMACFDKFVLGKTFKWVHPTNYTLNGTSLIIDFEVPVKPLVLDTTLVTQLDDNNYGFCIYNVPNEISNSTTEVGISVATTKITKVELISATQVKLTLSRTPVTGERLTYGVNGTGWQNITGTDVAGVGYASGHVSGPRGCLRDSYGLTNTETGVTIPDLYNWSVIFEHVF